MEALYMFAIMPPPELASRIDNERKIFSENYKCHRALKPPVHITLFEPFKNEPGFEDEITGLQQWAGAQRPFSIELKNFNFFRNRNSPVVYIDVVKNEHLTRLHRSFLTELHQYLEMERNKSQYSPHITIGYRDVPPAIFPEIIKNYSKRPFSASFEVNTVYLWKHDTRNWQVVREFTFGKPQVQASLF